MAFLRENTGEAADTQQLRTELAQYLEIHLGYDLRAFICPEGESIAAAAFLLIGERPPTPNVPNGRLGTVLNVYTRPELRRQGYAAEAVGAAEVCARQEGVSCLVLQATALGEPLYRTLGFSPDPSGDLPMIKRLE